jgi:integrase
MPRARNLVKEKHVRGVFEKVPGSNEWWVRWTDTEGKLRRQKVGRKSDAIAAYRRHKDEARAGKIVPVLRNTKAVTLSDLIDLALQHVIDHRSRRDYEVKAGIVRRELGNRPAADITPAEIDEWLNNRDMARATANRYKAFFSLCFKLGMANGKVKVNPARMVRQRAENNARLRFLSYEEYRKLHDVIQRRFPEHLAEFIVSVHSGMRLSEQFSCHWSQVDLVRAVIKLSKTKNGSARDVFLDSDALAAIMSLKAPQRKPSDLVFNPTRSRNDTRGWFIPCLKEAEITEYTWHSNRHTFCSWLAMNGASIKDIQELAGHKTVAISARYAHLSPDHKRSVIERLPSLSSKGAN